MSLRLVAGLGNPGPEYDATRHNAGFRLLALCGERWGARWSMERRFQSEVALVQHPAAGRLLLVRPQTYMNDSGVALRQLRDYHRVEPGGVIVAYDEINVPLGRVKVSLNGSAGGHNGVASLLQHLGGDFVRYRIGIGPKAPAGATLHDFVLGRFRAEEAAVFAEVLPWLADGLEHVLTQGPLAAMNRLHQRTTQQPPFR